ncbi:MAG: gamma-glutamyltransferase family protein [Ectothiorhodospiraceae bacterium]|nr:gamma-glutamyltransferase family protein [Ectothiorhodospiraceae bacterium]
MRDFELQGRSTVHTVNGMAATSHPLATLEALNVLQSGGNAMDAAIAACAVQCVVEPGSTGVGGDCFALYAKGGRDEIVAYNGSGRAPAAAGADWFADQGITQLPVQSPHGVTVPGAVQAWEQLAADHGTLPLARLLQSAIRHARDGYPVAPRQQLDWQQHVELLRGDTTASKIFLVNGEAPAAGALHRQPLLAQTLETIAAKGASGFYTGPVAEDMVGFLRSLGGLHTMEDFAAAQGEYVTPIRSRYRDYEVVECPPNGQGIIALLILNILAGFKSGDVPLLSAERLHREIEAGRLAYQVRNALVGDPAQAAIPVDWMLSEEHAATLRGQLDPTRRLDPLPQVTAPVNEDTVYITVVDKDRNCVSFINSIFSPFGSGLVAPRTGVLLHNRGLSFSLQPGHPNAIASGKRPLHSIIPGMLVRNGRVQMPFGVMGGHYQASGHAYFLSNLLDYGLDLQEAMDLPRMFAPPGSDAVQVEKTLPQHVREGLAQRGHRLVQPPRPIGGSQAIWLDWENGVLTGASDHRKDGCALGY